MGKFQDLTGQTFGNLKVIGKTTDPIKSKKGKGVYWDCECKCGKITQVHTRDLKSKHIQSCGCSYRPEHNDYEEYDENTYKFWNREHTDYFLSDKKNLQKILNYYWRKDSLGYWLTRKIINGKKKIIRLHKYLKDIDGPKIVVDHKDGNKDNNRDNNLRITTQQNNTLNKSIRTDNSSNICGVEFIKRINRWKATIQYSGKRITLGEYQNFNQAKFARYYGEVQIFKEFVRDYESKINYLKENKDGNKDIIEKLTKKIKKYYDIECENI